MIVFNIPGLLMLAAGFGVAFGAGSGLRMTGEGPLMIVAAPILIVADVWYRMTRGGASWFGPRGGGHLFFIPIWMLGVLWAGLGVVYTLQGH